MSAVRLPMSWEVYDSLEYDDALRGAEYMDGELIVPPGAPAYGHQKAIRYLEDQIRPTLLDGEDVISGFGWKPAGVEEEYIPDVMVCDVPTDERRSTVLPLLCVEVTSSNRENDLIRKRAKYAAAGLVDYWIVDRRDRAVRCHVLHDGVLVETSVHRRSIGPRRTPPVTLTYADGRQVDVDLAQLFL